MIPNQSIIQSNVRRALEEDIGTGDVTASLLPDDLIVSAVIKSREPLLLCGQPWVDMVFKEIDPEIKVYWQHEEGQWIKNPSSLCELQGAARSILTAERCALNFLQTLSATATEVHHYLELLKGTGAQLLDTRKTIPGLRHAQKYAVACAGGVNHRHGLYDAFLIKENHIKACGSIRSAIESARKRDNRLLVEVEVETLDEFREALQAKPDRILLDNFSLEELKQAVVLGEKHHCPLEASGGVTRQTIRAIAETGVHFISVGAVTKSIQAIDLSLLII
ncbi:carboxylating nicotinate-nucleotide diphosphorylase [Legionella impletisoli]|uniref:nicotinate-nucleotide diphosphorylase (carboxylating) n=1 Tax=Legionella impletisoli TaxID=343510 RepID=A0A917NDB1_9GAMM|nr:carboxylating nicotinate-nucleotide diphosphorylase [Legionella impletisoli]GGI91569.1 nicotinate-nucleotide diphosphorylase (carboxylating) [Legionella impletisoli]